MVLFYPKCRRFEKIVKMPSKPRNTKTYANPEEKPSIVDEPAVQYNVLRAILGGNKSVQKTIAGDFDLIALSREGIKKASLSSLAAHLGISMETLSQLLHSSYRNIQRKSDDDLLDTLKTEKVLELAAFAQRGIDVAGSKEAFIEWLHSPLIALGNKAPLDYLDTTFGIQLALKILGRLEQGVFS